MIKPRRGDIKFDMFFIILLTSLPEGRSVSIELHPMAYNKKVIGPMEY
jgi:hypothetical protein